MPRHWFIKTKSGKAGPITSKTLVRLAEEGKIRPNSGVSADGQSWLKAKHVVGLSFPEAYPRGDDNPKRWLVKTKGGDAGPFTLEKLSKLVRDGRVRADHAVSCDGQVWVKAKRVPELDFPETAKVQPAPSRTVAQTAPKQDESPPTSAPKQPKADDESPTIERDEEGVVPESEDGFEEAFAFAFDEDSADVPVSSDRQHAGIDQQRPSPRSTPEKQKPLLPAPKQSAAQWAALRDGEYRRRFGPVSEVSRSADSAEPAIDIYVHPATTKRPFTTLVTSGMSDRAMPVPNGGSGSPRAELVLYIQQEHPALIAMLRFLAQLPFQQSTQLSYGSIISNGDPATPIFEGSVLDSYIFMVPNIDSDFKIQESLRIDDDPLHMLWVVPITRAEGQFLSRNGMSEFCKLLDQNNHSFVFDPFRPCCVNHSAGGVVG